MMDAYDKALAAWIRPITNDEKTMLAAACAVVASGGSAAAAADLLPNPLRIRAQVALEASKPQPKPKKTPTAKKV